MMNRIKNRDKKVQGEWPKQGGPIKAPQAYLHPDEKVERGLVNYSVKYIGCIEIKESMRSLAFDLRAAVAKEAICRVVERASLRSMRKRKLKKEISRILGDTINLRYVKSNVIMTISCDRLILAIQDSGEIIVNHQMQFISFASGGDTDPASLNLDLSDFVAYVARDSVNQRACHVMECPDGLAMDVITTIGQAFELRYKEYLRNPPRAIEVSPTSTTFSGDAHWSDDESQGADDRVYYNDIGTLPPPTPSQSNLIDLESASHSTGALSAGYPQPDASRNTESCLDASIYNEIEHNMLPRPLAHSPDAAGVPSLVAGSPGSRAVVGLQTQLSSPTESRTVDSALWNPLLNGIGPPAPPPQKKPPMATKLSAQHTYKNVPPGRSPVVMETDLDIELGRDPGDALLTSELWYHGPLSRREGELLLNNDGEFLVRESRTTKGEIVLSGMQSGRHKHLLLIDPEGKVRMRERVFDNVSHLITHHKQNNLPIFSAGSTLHLKTPILKQFK